MKYRQIYLSILSLLWLLPLEAAERIIVWDRIQQNPVAFQVMQRALNLSAHEYGPYTLQISAPMEQGRASRELEKNQSVHIANFAPDANREEKLLPIRIPVTMGLLGYRVCLIREGAQARFDNIRSMQDLIQENILFGQGKHWPDVDILRDNGLKVITSAKYKSLFEMLKKRRFDCFSRSISEVMPELAQHHKQGVRVEKSILLAYRLPTFFFVSKKNPRLAERITVGMQRGLQDGSLIRLVRNQYRDDITHLHLKNRVIISLDNTRFTPETSAALDAYKYWFDIK